MTNQMTNEEAGAILKAFNQDEILDALWFTYKQRKVFSEALDMGIKALELLDKLDEIITKQIDISNNQIECQTLRWVLDKMSEVEE